MIEQNPTREDSASLPHAPQVEEPEHVHGEVDVPYGRFFLAVGAQLALALGIFYLIGPNMFRAEFSRPWMILLWTFLFGIPLSLFEYLYHRYLLHSAVLPFMSSMARAHGTHHGLTNVKAPVKAKEPEKLVIVESEFPIVEEHQEESMMFPFYSEAIFLAIFLLVMGLPFKLLLPGAPMLSATIFAVTVFYSAYEIWHQVLHLPFDKFWKPAMENRFVGKVVRRVYGFHLMHHWRVTSNLAIVGFWGCALWDYVFRTHRRPERMPLNQAEVNYVDSKLKKPRWPISVFDRWQGGWARWSRKAENFLARVFLRRGARPGS